MKKITGYSMVELLMAIALSTAVVGATTYIIYYFFSEKQALDVWSSTQIEMSLAIKSIESDLRNVVRLDPTEDLSTTDDGLFFGLTSVTSGDEPSECINDSTAAVARYTTLNRFLRSEKVLRSWSESADANKTAASNELRVTADDTKDSLFSDSKKPAEVVIVDADRRYIRRYVVGTVKMNLNSPKDPYDDSPKVDVGGKPILFNYASIFLQLPANIKGTPTSQKSAVFITGSDVYASSTYFVCLRKSDRSLIKVDVLQGQSTVLLQRNAKEFDITSFVMKYLGTKKGVRVDPVNFFADLQASPQGSCVNSIYLELNALISDKTGGNGSVVSMTKRNVSRGRSVFATNLNAKRALGCLQ